MNWELVSVAVGVIGFNYAFLRNFKQDIVCRLDRIESDIKNIDRRLTFMEGAFHERGYWESRKTGTEDKTHQ